MFVAVGWSATVTIPRPRHIGFDTSCHIWNLPLLLRGIAVIVMQYIESCMLQSIISSKVLGMCFRLKFLKLDIR